MVSYLLKSCFSVSPSDSELELSELADSSVQVGGGASSPAQTIDFDRLRVVEPRYLNAINRLRYRPLTDPSLSGKQILQAVGNFKWVPVSLKKEICSVISRCANYYPSLPVNVEMTLDCLHQQFSWLSTAELPFYTHIQNFSDKALSSAVCARDEILRANREDNIYNHLLMWQHRGFLHQIPWETLKPQLEAFLTQQFTNQNDCESDISDIKQHIHKEAEGIVGYEVGKYKAYKKEAFARLPATQVMTTNGELFELIKTLPLEQRLALAESLGVSDIQKNIGDGKFSCVQLARKMDTGDIVALKISYDVPDTRVVLDLELQSFERIEKRDHLISMLGNRSFMVDEEIGKRQNLLFMDFGGVIDCHDLYELLWEINRNDPDHCMALIDSVCVQMTDAVVELHSQGLCHHDVKPENFSFLLGWVYLIDYGMVNIPMKVSTSGTEAYIPPEFNSPSYDSIKHDAFSLGLALFNLLTSIEEECGEGEEVVLVVNGEDVVVPYFYPRDPRRQIRCLGIPNLIPSNISGNTLDEVIALLLMREPELRYTPQQVLQLPYFQNKRASQSVGPS